MKSMALLMRGALVVAGVLGLSATVSDARADGDDRRHGYHLTLNAGGTSTQGFVQVVTTTLTAVGAPPASQYRVNITGVVDAPNHPSDRNHPPSKLQCIVYVGSLAEAQAFRVDEHTAGVTCSVGSAAITDATNGTYVTINTAHPNTGDSIVIESR